jgi:hypothetical protein
MMKEGLRAARLLMILSSVSPLFILWAIRGCSLIPDHYFVTVCIFLVVIPNGFLWLRIRTAKHFQEQRNVVIGSSEDHRDHFLVYLFAMLLPFYSAELATWRDLATALVALGFIVFLFWHLNLHYINLIFAARGLRIFTVYSPEGGSKLSGKFSFVLITYRVSLKQGENVTAYRLSDTVFLETTE